MNARFLFPLSFCLALALLSCGCDSSTVAKKESDSANAEQKKASEAGSDNSAAETETPAVDPKAGSAQKDDAEADAPKMDAPKSDDAAAKSGAAGAAELSDKEVVVADGGIKLMLPTSWESVKPRSFVVEHEIKIPKSEGEADDAKDGRLTIMGAGGSVDANLVRWYGQYSQPDGSDSKDAAKISESTVGDCKVTWFDLSGTLLDKPGGPMAGGKMVERENYRTLAAIIQAGDNVGQYFVKVYGPAKTITDNEAAFKAFVESLKVNPDGRGL